jgi:hypothetical protein
VIRRGGVTKYIMLTTIAMAGGRTAQAADWSGTLEAALNAAYVTNPTLVPHSDVSDENAQLSVDGTASAQTERGQLTVTPRFLAVRYDHEKDLNINEGGLDVAFVEKLERGQWSVEAQGLTDSTITSELGTTGVTYVNRRHDAATLSLGYQYLSTERLSWQLQGGGQITRYSDAAAFGLTNYDYYSLSFGPTWSFSERVQGSLILEADRLNPQEGTRQNDFSAYLQLKRSFTEQYSWRVSVGGTRIDYGSSPGSPAGSASTSSFYEVGTTRKGERLQWDLSLKRSVLPIGIGLLAPQTVLNLSVVAATSERSTLTVSLNGIRTDPVFFDQLVVYAGGTWGQASGEWRYQLSPHWTLSAAYIYGRSRYNSNSDWANGNQARLGIVWNSGRL